MPTPHRRISAPFLSLCLAACSPADGGPRDVAPAPDALVPAVVTEPVLDDSDDPAVWVDPDEPSRTLILGTDKGDRNGGVYAFDLDGRIDEARTVRGLARPNNVDVETGFVLGGDTVALAVATERRAMALRVFRLPDMTPVDGGGIPVFGGAVGDTLRAPMGVALYRRTHDGTVFAIVGGKSGPADGYLHQLRLADDGTGRVVADSVRAFGRFSGLAEIEAIAVDDEAGFVYYSDEGSGIRKYHADPDHPDAALELAHFGTDDFAQDHEGIAIYTTGEDSGYLLVSDQQAGALNVYRREGEPGAPHRHLLVARVPVAAQDTDGVEAVSTPLPGFPEGLVVMMSTDATFHYYRWEDVRARIEAGSPPPDGQEAVTTTLEPSPLVQTASRVRTDVTAPLNADEGWGAGIDEAAEVLADRPFRLRFEAAVPLGAEAPRGPLGLQVRRNRGPWEEVLARDFPYPDEISTPRVSVVETRGWAHGTATADLLAGSELPFAGGSGVNLDSVTASPLPTGDGVHGEWEWPLVVRRYADGAVRNEAGDRFEFRMVDAEGRPVLPERPAENAGSAATVTLVVPPGHLGGTFVETPGVLGPWQSSDGTLYFPMEPAETFNVLMMVRSPDRGVSWNEVDGDHRPATDDLEGFATAWHDGRIHLLHQISEATYLHTFATADAPGTGDRWVVRDELVGRHSEPPTQVAALVAHPDGRLTAFYGDSLGLRWRVRGPEGGWGPEGTVDTEPGLVASGVMATLGRDGRIHLAYTADDGTRRGVWYRTLETDGRLGPATRLADGVGTAEEDIGAVVPLVHLPDDGSTVIPYRLADGHLYERTVRADGSIDAPRRITDRRVVQNGADSEQVGADAVGYEGAVVVAFIDEESRDVWVVRRDPDGTWDTATPAVEGVTAQWVRGRVVAGPDGTPVYGVVVDAGSDGGSGMNRYVEISLGRGG